MVLELPMGHPSYHGRKAGFDLALHEKSLWSEVPGFGLLNKPLGSLASVMLSAKWGCDEGQTVISHPSVRLGPGSHREL